jgi:hypothetical protein
MSLDVSAEDVEHALVRGVKVAAVMRLARSC